MRKGDLELLEIRFEPLQTARDRHNESINTNTRNLSELTDRVKDLERDGAGHALSIEQGLASIRSLLQRANRMAREQGIIEEEEEEAEVDTPGTGMNVRELRDVTIRTARARHQRGNLL